MSCRCHQMTGQRSAVTLIPSALLVALAGAGLLGFGLSKRRSSAWLSLIAGTGLAGLGTVYNTAQVRDEIDRIVSEGGIYGDRPNFELVNY